jgi:hypothetical protein
MSEDTVITRPGSLEEYRGKPKKMYKLIKADLLTPTELDTALNLAFNVEDFDPEDELQTQMFVGIKLSRERLAAQKQKELDNEAAQARDRAKEWLRNNNPEVPVDQLPDPILDEIANSINQMMNSDICEDVTIVARDEENMVLVTDSGEVIGFLDAPRDDLERRNILEWLGERLTTSQARAAGFAAEKEFWLKKIGRQYDPQINRQTRIQKQLSFLYAPMAQAYLDEVIANFKGKTPPRSVKVGMLLLKYTKTQSRVDILDENKALSYAEENFPDAIKVERSILKSQIPDDLKKKLTEDQKTASGIFFYPGGEDKFDLK